MKTKMIDNLTLASSVAYTEQQFNKLKKQLNEAQRNASLNPTQIVVKESKEIRGPKGDKGDTGDTGLKGDKGDLGLKGDTGLKGDKGDKGDTGETGLKGDTGDIGPKGDKGDLGLKGDKGDKGDTGDIGLKGDKGDTGETGLKGDTGDTGLKGDKGDAGDLGPKGDKGDTGDIGLKGDKGDTGDIGPKGETGKIGLKGDKGDIGPKGDKGDPGQDADTTKIEKKINDFKENLNKDLLNYKNTINSELTNRLSYSSLGGGEGGGSVRILDNDDVEYKKLQDMTENSILVFNLQKQKFVVTDLVAFINNIILGLDMQYNKLVDVVGTYTYIGEALPGTATSSATWRIKRIETLSGGDLNILWASGSSDFNKIWNNRASFAYS